jgi:hypothetical protein
MSQLKRITQAKDGSVTVRLRNVRLSFPALWTPRAFSDGKGESAPDAKKTYQATFLMAKPGLDPKDDNAKLCLEAVAMVVKAGLKGKHPGKEKVAIRAGDEKGENGVDGYSDKMCFVGANSSKKLQIVDRDLSPLQESDGKPYAGCFVNATVRFWPQDNKWGKRVNAQLRAIQFWGDGEPFGEAAADAAEEFADTVDGAGSGGEEASGDGML